MLFVFNPRVTFICQLYRPSNYLHNTQLTLEISDQDHGQQRLEAAAGPRIRLTSANKKSVYMIKQNRDPNTKKKSKNRGPHTEPNIGVPTFLPQNSTIAKHIIFFTVTRDMTSRRNAETVPGKSPPPSCSCHKRQASRQTLRGTNAHLEYNQKKKTRILSTKQPLDKFFCHTRVKTHKKAAKTCVQQAKTVNRLLRGRSVLPRYVTVTKRTVLHGGVVPSSLGE